VWGVEAVARAARGARRHPTPVPAPLLSLQVMVHGYDIVHHMAAGLQSFMRAHGFEAAPAFVGAALPRVVLHSDLVTAQRAAVAARKRPGLAADDEWRGDAFVAQSDSMVDGGG